MSRKKRNGQKVKTSQVLENCEVWNPAEKAAFGRPLII